VGVYVLQCKTQPVSPYALHLFVGGWLLAAPMIWLLVIPRLKRLIEANPEAFDLSRMEYWLSAPLKRLDGRNVRGMASILIGAGLAGGGLARTVLKDVDDSIFLGIVWILAVLISGGAAGGQCYLAWFARRESKKAGRPMALCA
jgi:hypothetical protein